MRILKIKITNITSFEGENVIDFTRPPLRDADLFAITGDTGAGKSTILDAVCLSLFNKAPRFSFKEKNSGTDENTSLTPFDTRNALRRGAKEGAAAVTFSTSEGTFEAVWRVRVKRTGTYDRVQRTLTRTAPSRHDYDPREVQTEIDRLTGLDYEQFTRTVILAQNGFANFLKAKRDEKSGLLEKITGTEIYTRISKAIFEQAKNASIDYENKLHEYDILKSQTTDEAKLAELEAKRNLTDSQIKQTDSRLEYLKSQIAWYKTYDELDAKANAATAAYNEANRTNVSLTIDRERLQRYDDVAPIRDRVVSVRLHEQKIAEAQKAQETLAAKSEEAEREVRLRNARLSETREDLNKSESQLSQTEPLLKKAYEIQHTIEMQESIRRDKTAEYNKLKKEAEALSGKIDNASTRLKILDDKNDALRTTMQALAPHQPMLDQYGSVIEKIRNYASLIDDAEKMKKRQNDINTDLDDLSNRLDKVNAGIAAATQKKESLEGNRTQIQNSILGIDHDTLQKTYNDAYSQRAELQGARRLWDQLTAEYAEHEANEKIITSVSASIEARKAQLKELELKTTEYRKEYEIYEKYYNLSQADDIKELKRNLREGQPCPICGATHHPAISHSDATAILDEVAGNAERDRDKAREKYNAFEEKYNNARNRQTTEGEKLNSLREKRSEIESRIERDVKEWQRYATLDKTFADCSPNVNADARRVMIIQLTENADRTVEETEKKLAEYNRCRSDIDRYNTEIEKCTANIADLMSRRSDILMHKGTDEGNLATITENIKSNSENAHELYSDLERLLTVADWRRLIRSDNKLLRDNITELYNHRNDCEAGLRKIEEERGETDTDVRLLSDSLSRTQTGMQQLTSRIEDAANAVNASRNDIFKLFGGEDPSKVEEKLRTQTADARKALDTAVAEAHRAAQSLSAVKAQISQSSEEQQKLEKEKLALSTGIDTWISAFNQNHSPVQFPELVKIFDSSEDWTALRSKLREAETNLSLSTDRLRAAQEALNTWQSRPEHPDRTTETPQSVASDIEALERKRREAYDTIRSIDETLGSHHNAMEKMKEIKPALDEMERNSAQWNELNDLVGSFNGKNFSLEAQKYTLSFLVDHANMQLSLFSPRYRLMRAGDSLDLEIIDQYMDDETRPVSCLSGGETFIVSLALALGLASLSSQRLSIESLFIDEGFGNLDSQSLDMVINALSSLNAQGRKVGVISHTEQIRDNIFPQIRVTRSSSSSSRSTITVASD